MRRVFQFILIVAIVASFFYGRGDIARMIERIAGSSDAPAPLAERGIEERIMDISIPGPLVQQDGAGTSAAPFGARAGDLTAQGIIKATNAARAEAGLAPLAENGKLASSARMKVDDMFLKQYFEHDSPSGVGINDLGERAGYAFIVIGENLALGNFGGSEAVVAAWMESPGHRANILNDRFTEIGVSALEGTYQGKRVWMAVQHFGRPLALCPRIDAALGAVIEVSRAKLDQLGALIEESREELESGFVRDRDEVDAYNAMVREYNDLAETLKEDIAAYNAQVEAFNACAAS